MLLKRMIFTLCLILPLMAYADSRNDILLKQADTKVSGEYVRQQFIKLLDKPFTDNAKKKLLVIGDSHAQDFINMVVENHLLSDYQISTRDIPTRCQPILVDNAQQYIAEKDKAFCEKADSLKKAKPKIAQADVIILVANWKKWSAKELPNTIKNLQLKPEQKLFIIGRKSFGKIKIRKYLRMSDQQLRNLQNTVDGEQVAINQIMQKRLDKSQYIDFQQAVCGAIDKCRVFTSDLKLISFDGGHLTKDGAAFVGRILFKATGLREL